MQGMNGIKDVTKLKIPSNYVLLEVVSKEAKEGMALPDGIKAEAEPDVYSKVVVSGSKCERLEAGDVVLLMVHEPQVGFPVNDKNYILTYEDNCAVGLTMDNLDLTVTDDEELVA